MWHVSTQSIFCKKRISLPNITCFTVKSPRVLKDWFLKKMFLKEQKPVAFFFSQNNMLK